MAGTVLLEVEDDGLARLTLNRPDAANGMNVELLKDLHEQLLAILGNPDARCVLFTGAGKNFCAGGDVKDFASKGDKLPDYLREATAWLGVAAQQLIRLEVPVVTAVQGFAAGGGGLGLVCASDIVFAGESTKFMSAATRVGMAPDAGTTATLSRLVGHRRALELVLTPKILKAQEAYEWGLITRVVPDDELLAEAESLARELAAGPTLALGATKQLMWNGLGGSVDDAFPAEGRTVSELSGTHDALEGLAAVIEKRDPVYTGKK